MISEAVGAVSEALSRARRLSTEFVEGSLVYNGEATVTAYYPEPVTNYWLRFVVPSTARRGSQ